ncbi:hypothetical protein AMTRI_Chr06g178910 [Amborella trichopoda]
MDKVTKKVNPFRLATLLRLEKDPKMALQLFQSPKIGNPSFRYSSLSYDLIIQKLGKAKMFEQMEAILQELQKETRFTPPEQLFCSVIKFYGRDRKPQIALQTYERIPSFRCPRTVRALNTLLNALLNCRDMETFGRIHDELDQYASPDLCTYNILIKACCLNNSPDHAFQMFEEMVSNGIQPNAITFGTLITSLCSNSRLNEAFRLKEDMVWCLNVQPNSLVYTSLMKGLFKANELARAFQLKEEMVDNGIELDSGVYSTLIAGLCNAGRMQEIDGLLKKMKSNGCEPDIVTYNAIICGLCKEADLESAFGVLNEITKKGHCKPDVFTYNILIGGLCRQGRAKEAAELVEDMPRRGCFPDVVTYRILFDGLCREMEFAEAGHLLDEMTFKGFYPRSAHKLVEGLCKTGDLKLLDSVLSNMAEGLIMDLSAWELAVGTILCENRSQELLTVIDIIKSA